VKEGHENARGGKGGERRVQEKGKKFQVREKRSGRGKKIGKRA